MLIDFRLKVFLTVASTLSFTKSAIQLNVSQPAVTKHVKELEREVGAPLFFRRGSSIALTENGRALIPYAKAILEKYECLNEAIAVSNHTYNGVLHVGASTTVLQYVLAPILAKFHNEYPDVSVVITTGNSEEIARKVMDESLDLAIVEDSSVNPSLHYEKLADDEIVLVTAHGELQELTIDDIRSIPLVIRESGSGTLAVIEKTLSTFNIYKNDLNIVMQLGGSEGIMRYLMYSNAYAFISIAAARDGLKEQKIRLVEVDELEILRSFRFISLHGKQGRLAGIFKSFCITNYNI